MNFDYKKIAAGVSRPIIPVGLEYKGIRVRYEALVDSGADYCIFPSEIGEALGIDILAGEKDFVIGITGNKEPIYFHKLVINVGGHDFDVRVAFKSNIEKFGHGLLGQRGFFDIFVVKFDLLKGRIEIFERDWKKK